MHNLATYPSCATTISSWVNARDSKQTAYGLLASFQTLVTNRYIRQAITLLALKHSAANVRRAKASSSFRANTMLRHIKLVAKWCSGCLEERHDFQRRERIKR